MKLFLRPITDAGLIPAASSFACSALVQLHNWYVHIAGPAGFVTAMSEMVRGLGCDDILADKF